MKKIAVFTSGGDAPGMNACLRAVVRTAKSMGVQEVFGIRRGYAGMIAGDFVELNERSVSGIIQNGGTILQSARSKEFRTKEGRKEAFKNLDGYDIEGVVAIGGDGTFTGAKVFMNEHKIPFIGVPGTIDNDLFGTDMTIGYDTALNTAMEAIDKIKDTADAHDRLFFVEVMGRDAGFIAIMTGIATGAEAVLVPETETDIDKLAATLEKNHRRKKTSSIVIVAEGDDEGGAFDIARKVKERFDGYEVRVTVLGHIQRGGRPTCADRVLASRLGIAAVEQLLAGKSNLMIGMINNKIETTSFEKAIKHHQEISPKLLDIVKLLS